MQKAHTINDRKQSFSLLFCNSVFLFLFLTKKRRIMLTEKLLHNYSNFSSLILVSYIQGFKFLGFETKYNNYFNFHNLARKFSHRFLGSFEKIVQKLSRCCFFLVVVV